MRNMSCNHFSLEMRDLRLRAAKGRSKWAVNNLFYGVLDGNQDPNGDQEQKSVCGQRETGGDLSTRGLGASGSCIWELGLGL